MKALINKIKKDKYFKYVIGVFLIGTFLRFYRLNAFITFLGDQGRDAIVIKRILFFEHFPAIGAPTSIGQVYLGPFYYYFIAPWLLLFNLNPLGLAFGVALISSVFILINYLLIKELFNEKIAFMSTVFLAFSKTIIEFSRFSWNPNLLPYFSFLLYYFFVKSLRDKKYMWSFLSGMFLSFSLQLHYLSLFFIPSIILLYCLELIRKKGEIVKILKNAGVLFISFIFFSVPLFIFDFRHNFLNLNNFIALSKTSSNISENVFILFFKTFPVFNQYVFNVKLNAILLYAILTILIFTLIYLFKKNWKLTCVLIFFLLTYFCLSLFGGPKYPHYFLELYIFYFILLSYFLYDINNIKFGKIIIFIFLISFIFTNMQDYYIFKNIGSFQLEKAKKISRIIFNNIDKTRYSITSLPMNYSDTTYRYFLEIWNKKPIDKESFEKGQELFVICEDKCDPLNSPQWDIAYFGGNKIEETWKSNNVKIYKLIKE